MMAHALLGASSAHRWLHCTKSARLEEQFPDTTSDAAKEGTLAHTLAEAKVRNYFHKADFSKRKLTNLIKKLREDASWQDEMDGYTDEYLDYIKEAALAFGSGPSVMLEKRVDYSVYVPEGFGTADCILLGGGTLHIIDFKYGKSPKGRVSAIRNPQLSLYALGAYETYKILYPIKDIRMSIVQPRLDNTSEWGCSLQGLLDWAEWMKERARLAWEGGGHYFVDEEKVCKFCRARAQCRARADYFSRQADDINGIPPIISPEEAGERLLALEGVAQYQKDLQAWALSECLSGREVPGWKAVEGRSIREWTDMDAAFKALKENDIDEAVLYEKKPLTLAQVEKIVGKKDFNEIAGAFVMRPPGKPALVREDDKRPAITDIETAREVFKEDRQV